MEWIDFCCVLQLLVPSYFKSLDKIWAHMNFCASKILICAHCTYNTKITKQKKKEKKKERTKKNQKKKPPVKKQQKKQQQQQQTNKNKKQTKKSH